MDLFLVIEVDFALMRKESFLLIVEEIFTQRGKVLRIDKAQIDFPTQKPLATLLYSNRK
jgi:hypothetical protein